MANTNLAERVDTLEYFMKELAYQSLKTERELAQLSFEMRQFKEEMRLFKKEMGQFKDEMGEFKDEMRVFKDEMGIFKDEMSGFKNEMLAFKNQAEKDRKDSNRRWGDLANKMGTLVEDIVAPSLPRVALELFGCETPEFFAVRLRRRDGERSFELDALLVCPKIVIVNETKSNLNAKDVDEFSIKLRDFKRWYPEYEGREVWGLIASLYVLPAIVERARKNKLLAMGMSDGVMQVLNPEIA